MNDESDSGEKTEEPSLHRIEEFRKRGEVAASKELTSVLVLTACIMVLTLSMVFIYEELNAFMHWLFSQNLEVIYQPKNFKLLVEKIAKTCFVCTGPLFLTVICVATFANVAQIGFLFSPEVLTFKPERINPVEGFKKLFSMRAVVEVIKSLFKFIFILSIVYVFMKDEISTFGGYYHVGMGEAFLHGKWILTKLALYIVLGLIVVAIGDFTYQKMSYRKKLMQTKQEAKRESKEQDGNPEIKQRIRQIQREAAQKRMMDKVPKANVIVTNPTHISVALMYDAETMVAPEVVAKGSDLVALRIREIAKEHNIPIVENVPLARTLHKTVRIGQGVPRSLYKAVAEVLAFVYKLKNKRKVG